MQDDFGDCLKMEPWKDPHPEFPDLIVCCKVYSNSNQTVLHEYDRWDQIQQGIVKVVCDPEHLEAKMVLHHAMIQRDKDTTKLRIV